MTVDLKERVTQVLAEEVGQALNLDGTAIEVVDVTDGVVHYFGGVDSDEERQAARVAAENVPGVRRVEDHRVVLAATVWAV